MLKEQHNGMKKIVLVVDDDIDYQNAVKNILENANLRCIQAYSMKEGLDKVIKLIPDLIILDVMLEDISGGFRFIKDLREFEKHNNDLEIPILMITNIQNITDINLEDQINIHALKIKDFLDKPVEPKTLLENVTKFVNH